MRNIAVPQRTTHSYTYRVEWRYEWVGSREQLFPAGSLTAGQTTFQNVDISGTVNATFRDKVDGPDINCTMQIVPDPAAPPTFNASYDSSLDELRISNVDAPTFRLGKYVELSHENCVGGPGVNIFSPPADWSPLGGGGGKVSARSGGTQRFDRRWQWSHSFAGGEVRNYDASIQSMLEVLPR